MKPKPFPKKAVDESQRVTTGNVTKWQAGNKAPYSSVEPLINGANPPSISGRK